METKENNRKTAEDKQVKNVQSKIPGHLSEDLGHAGREMVRTAHSFFSGQDTSEQTGERKLRKYGMIAGNAAALAGAIGGHAAAQIQKAKSEALAEGAVHAEQLVKRGVLKKSDLKLGKKELKKKLRDAGVKTKDSWGVVKNASAIHEALTVKEELVKLKAESPDPAHVFSRLRDYTGKNVPVASRMESAKNSRILTSEEGRFFNSFRYGKNTQYMIDVWFQTNGDPAIRHLRPAQMSRKEIWRMLKNKDRYHLSATDTAMLRVLLESKTAQRERAMDRYFSGMPGAVRSARSLMQKGIYLADQTGDVSMQGYHRLVTIYSGVRTVEELVHLVARSGVTTVRALHQSPPAKAVRRRVGGAVSQLRSIAPAGKPEKKDHNQHDTGSVHTKSGQAVRTMRPRFRTNGRRIRTLSCKDVFLKTRTETVHTVPPILKNAQSGYSRARQSIRRVKRSKPVQGAAFAGRRFRDAIRAVFYPAKLLGSGIARTQNMIRKILAAVFAVVFAVVLIFLVLILFSAFITTLGNSTGEIIENVITDQQLKDHIDHLNERNRQRFEEAQALGKGKPRHDENRADSRGLCPDEALYGVHLYHYGVPRSRYSSDVNLYHNDLPGETTGGVRYYYLNSQGEEIAHGTTNTKDILCLTSVMVSNDYDEEVVMIAPELLDQWFDILNPEPTYTVSELYHAEGSDMFLFDGHTYEGADYRCTDAGFYTEYENAKSQGVKFYELPHDQTTEGCRVDWDTYEEARDDWWEERPEWPEYPNRDDYETREEWLIARDAYYEAVEKYYEDHDEWDARRPNYEDYKYCPGHHAIRCSYGYRDIKVYVTVLTKEDVYRAAENGGMISYQVPKDYDAGTFETKTVSIDIPEDTVTKEFKQNGGWSNQKNRDWCDRLYGGDWYSMYGVEVYDDSGADPAARLTPEQIRELQERYGDLSAAREELLNFAISYTGRIPYYWGGKPSCPGFEGNNFGSLVDADYKGRDRKGLDCSGFVGWVYWSVIGVKPSPAMTTSDLVPSLGLARISFSEIRPGDIGMEALPGASDNHIGYFVGFDADGRAKWVHCNSGSRGVAVDHANCFRYYYRLFDD